ERVPTVLIVVNNRDRQLACNVSVLTHIVNSQLASLPRSSYDVPSACVCPVGLVFQCPQGLNLSAPPLPSISLVQITVFWLRHTARAFPGIGRANACGSS